MRPTKMLLPLLLGCMLTQQVTATPSISKTGLSEKRSSSLCFLENKGQIVDQHHNPRTDIDFKLTAGNGLNIFIGAGKIHYQWAKHETAAASTQDGEQTIMYRMDVTLVGANPEAEYIVEEKQAYFERYYLPQTGPDGVMAQTYRKITYKDVYPQVDWVFRINELGKLEHDFIVHPGGKVSDIRLKYHGADNISYNGDGSITATTAFGSVTENAPYCFEETGKTVAGAFVLTNNVLSFSTASHQGTLIIDPVLEWATYFGGTGRDQIKKLQATDNGIIYITGLTESSNNIATSGAFQTVYSAGEDVFVTKFDQSGSCIWSTYYGSAVTELAFDISCDPWENLYISGATSSNIGIATPGAHQTVFGGGAFDAFLLKLDSAGSRSWCTYYGGEANDYTVGDPVAVACDNWGNIYLAGSSNSIAGISTPGVHQEQKLGTVLRTDAFLARFDTSGRLIWGSYFGGTSYEYLQDVTCDIYGNIFITGRTNSTAIDGVEAAAHQPSLSGQYDYFLAMFDSTGTVKWGTYYGGSGQEYPPASVGCDAYGHVYLTGTSASSNNISTANSYQPNNNGGGADAFLAKFDTTGTRIWSTYFGGERDEYGTAITFDALTNIYLAGRTNSTTGIATSGSLQQTNGGNHDMFFTKFDSSGQLRWATYYGGVEEEYGLTASADRIGNLYIGGMTRSITDISTPGTHQILHGGGGDDGLLIRINDCDLFVPDTITGPLFVCRGGTAQYSVAPMPGVQSYIWTLPASWQGSSSTDSITIVAGGNSDTIRVAAQFFCGTGPEQSLFVSVSPEPMISVPGGTALCAGDSIELYANVSSGISWEWMYNGSVIPNEHDSVLLTTQSGSYRVITTIAHCTDTSEPVVVHPLPHPVITQDGSTLRTDDYYVSYQWYYGAQSITGANQHSYTFVAEGDYRVEVVDTNGCTGMSAPFASVGVGVGGFASKHSVLVYPNPAQSVLHVNVPKAVSLIIGSMDGRVVMRTNQVSSIDVSELAEGLYLLQVLDESGNLVHKEKWEKQAE